MANNGLTSPEALAEAPPSGILTESYVKWISVSFPHVYLDPTILNRQASIEAFYLGYLEAVRVIKKKKYQALFRWTETPNDEPGYADFVLTVFTSPPPTKDSKLFKASALTDTGMEDPETPEDDIDPPTPPKPPPPPM